MAQRLLPSARHHLARLPRRAAEMWQRLLDRSPEPLARAARIARSTVVDASRDRVPRLAAEIAFYGLLALPPALLAVLGSVGYVLAAVGGGVTRQLEQQIVAVAGNFLTTSTIDQVVKPTVQNVLNEGRAGIVGVGLLVALWAASRATSVVMEVVRIAHDVDDRRPALRRRLVALGYTVVLVLGLVVLLPILVVGPRVSHVVGSAVGLGDLAVQVWQVAYWPVVSLATVALLATIYHFVVPRDDRSWWGEVPGALLALGTWILGGLSLRIYARWNIESSSVFGPLSSPLILLLWLYLTGFALLIGVELNAALEKHRAAARRAGRSGRG